MKITSALLTIFFAAVLLAAGPASAAWFLKIDGIPGESSDPTHRDWIEVQGFSLGAQSHVTLGPGPGQAAAAKSVGAGAGKVRFNEFTIKKTTDTASPAFFRNCASGAHYKKVTLEMRKAGGDPKSSGREYLRFVFHDCTISNFTGGSARGGGIAADGLTLNYSRADVEGLEPNPTPTHATLKPVGAAPKAVTR
jgi:type VI secretion system secreted protein Hcp